MREYMRKRTKELGVPIKYNNPPLADLTIVTVRGQQRVKGAVLLEKLQKEGKIN